MPVEGHVVDPVYVFDQLAIPVGSKVLGHVTQVDELSRKQRALTIANGDFTPIRRAQLGFDTLVLKDGRQLPLDAVVSQGIPNILHLTAGEQADKKKGGVSGAVEQARQEVKTREQRTVKEMTARTECSVLGRRSRPSSPTTSNRSPLVRSSPPNSGVLWN